MSSLFALGPPFNGGGSDAAAAKSARMIAAPSCRSRPASRRSSSRRSKGEEVSDSLDSILLEHHLADLRRSGLSNEQIRRCGFRSSSNPVHVAKWLRWTSPAKTLVPCLCIPFHGADGKALGYVRVKPDKPRKSKDGGKTIKYESPKGAANRSYFPPATRAALADSSIPLLVTEGEKKSAKADQEGFACIGLVGVYGFQKARPKDANGKGQGPRELIPDLAAVAWRGRKVFIAYDSDLTEKEGVQWAEFHLAETLQLTGADVLAVRIPPAADGSKQGLDDYLVAAGPDAFRELFAAAKPVEKPAAEPQPNEAPDNPHRLTDGYLDTISPGGPPLLLRSWRDEFHRYTGGAYHPVPDGDLRGELVEWVRREFVCLNLIEMKQWREKPEGDPPKVRNVSTRLINDVLQALRGCCLLPASVDAPAWIGPPYEPGPTMILPMRNGLLDLAATAEGRLDCLLPPTPYFFTSTAAPFDFDPKAPAPLGWLQFLSELWPDDSESIATLQEWFGLLLVPDTRQQKILFLLGPKRSGKGTIARVLRELIGAANVAGPTLAGLATNFGLWPRPALLAGSCSA